MAAERSVALSLSPDLISIERRRDSASRVLTKWLAMLKTANSTASAKDVDNGLPLSFAELTAATARVYSYCWRRWQRWCADRGTPAFPAQPELIVRYILEMHSSGARIQTIRMMVSMLNKAHEGQGELPANSPLVKMELQRISRQTGRSPRPIEARVIADAALAEYWATRDTGARRRALVDAALALLVYGEGLKFSEVEALRWNDIDFESLTVKVKVKGGKLTLTLKADTASALRDILPPKASASDPVFESSYRKPPPKRPLTPAHLSRRLSMRLAQAGLHPSKAGSKRTAPKPESRTPQNHPPTKGTPINGSDR
jgi:integrase